MGYIKKMCQYLNDLGIFKFENDEEYIKKQYKKIMKKELDLSNPKTFNEKIQWLKINDRNPIYTIMVDKYEAKKYVADIIGEEYIIPTIGIYNKFEDIEFDKLPKQFVMKCTHDSGGLFICTNKDEANLMKQKIRFNLILKRNYYYRSREWAYKNVPHRIIIEKYMKDKQNKELKDYKFYCFNGKPQYLYVSEGLNNHQTAKIDFFNMNFEKAPFYRADYSRFNVDPEKPKRFEEMKLIAEKLAQNLKFIRVDLYEIEDKIYFSELTLYPCGGMMPFKPEEWDQKLGELIKI